MGLINSGANFNDIISGLAALRRRAQMTGRNITGQDMMNMQEPVFAANREYAPAARALEEQKRQEEARLQMEKDAMDANKTGGIMQSGVNAIGTGMTAYNMLKPTPTPGAVQEPGMISKAGTMIKDMGTNALDKTGLWSSKAATVDEMPQLLNSTEPFMAGGGGAEIATTTGDLATDAGIDTSGAIMGEGAGSAGTGLLSTTGTVLGNILPYGAAMGAAKLLGTGTRMITGDTDPNNEKMDYFSRTGRVAEGAFHGLFKPLQKEVGGVPANMRPIADLYHDIHNPAGWALERLGCIIITACTDAHSPEVELAREYRDKFLTPDQLRGYYMVAERVVPKIEKSARVKGFIKKALIDNLIEYGRYALNKTPDKPSFKSMIITNVFLGLCWAVGLTKKSFKRANGEVF